MTGTTQLHRYSAQFPEPFQLLLQVLVVLNFLFVFHSGVKWTSNINNQALLFYSNTGLLCSILLPICFLKSHGSLLLEDSYTGCGSWLLLVDSYTGCGSWLLIVDSYTGCGSWLLIVDSYTGCGSWLLLVDSYSGCGSWLLLLDSYTYTGCSSCNTCICHPCHNPAFHIQDKSQ